ncbi:MAG: hypothetical protein C3F13_13735 [Anaerolineales bacterium]|nr:sensor histidine kinase [Anaerolineae bacterium]PWB51499.1 MAG: hypothetical protein C3F13_13735 [Anaerolineales bacterium]
MRSGQTTERMHQSVFLLAAGLTYAAILLRSALTNRDTANLAFVVEALLGFLALFLVEQWLSPRIDRYFHFYLLVQTTLVCLLFYNPDLKQFDYYSLLFGILGMQVMRQVNRASRIAWLVIFFILISYRFISLQGVLAALINVLLFGSVIIFLCAYSLSTRQAEVANEDLRKLMNQVQTANQQLETYSDTRRQLGIANERQRLRRELHDSVTQTIFSMTLTTQSALLLMDRDPTRVSGQLDRLNQLVEGALEEMHTLISELRPDHMAGIGLVAEFQKEVERRRISDGLAVSVQIDGEQTLSVQEDQALFHILQEALNNIIKHAQASQASFQIHLDDPMWIEAIDNGTGFSRVYPSGSSGLGIPGMHERANEINWDIKIQSAPGEGTRIHLKKNYQLETNCDG